MNSIELFAGAGGLGLGLHSAGFNPSLVVEWNRDCCDTIRENQKRKIAAVRGWKLIEGDVRQADFRSFEGKVQLVSGGPPCQPFSLGGKHRAYADNRDMFPQAIRAVREVRPEAFIFENVKGLTRATFRNYYEYVRLQLEHPEVIAKSDEDWTEHLARLQQHYTASKRHGLNYRVVTQVLNAANFGVPQKRERVFFVGFRDDLKVEWHFPLPTHSSESLAWDKEFGDYWERHGISRRYRIRVENAPKERPSLKPWATVRDAISDLPDPERQDGTDYLNHKHQPGARSYKGHTGSPIDEPAKALKAGVHGVPGGENMLLRQNGSVRYFTVRESARLQTFPDNFLFHGSWTEAMRQLGNAVPVALAKVVGRDVAKHLSAVA